MRVLSSQLKDYIGQEVKLLGRLYGLRKMGGITFVILQDRKGLAQMVFEQEITAKVGSVISISG